MAMAAPAVSGRREVVIDYHPVGAARELFRCRAKEVVLSGPAGTGKSFGCLHKLHLAAGKYAGMRGLIVRKTRTALTQAALVTFEKAILHPLDGVQFHNQDQEYRYPNGSVVVVGGLDKSSKVMSSEYDMIYPQEATELTEDDWESLTTRLRYGRMPYQQIIGDCNPDAPSHWLKQRANRHACVMLESRHSDNPLLWDARRQEWTPQGRTYMAVLDALTGVRYQRLRLGLWVAAEGMVYEGWDRALHLIDPCELPDTWPRYWVVDFGFTHPFVWQAWAEDPDGRLYRYREIYQTGQLVEDMARQILALHGASLDGGRLQWPVTVPRPHAIICDHDAEDRATLERHLGMPTVPAFKAVSPGIQAVAARLRPAGDSRPRLLYVRDALVSRDPALDARKKPACTEEEPEGYIWDTRMGRAKGEEPVKQNDHGMDTTRYMVAYADNLGAGGVQAVDDDLYTAMTDDRGLW